MDEEESLGFSIWGIVMESTAEYVGLMIEPMTTQILPFARVAVTVYILWVAWRLLFGQKEVDVGAAISSVLVILATYSLTLETNAAREWIFDPVLNTSLGLTGFFLDPNSGTVSAGFKAIDGTFENIFALILDIEGEESWFGMWERIVTIIIMTLLGVIYGLLYLVFTALLLVGGVGLQVYFVMLPLVGVFAAFKETRHFFFGWLKGVANMGLIPPVTGIIMGLSMTAISAAGESLTQINIERDGLFNAAVGASFLIGGISLFFHFKAPEFVSTLLGTPQTQMGSAGSVVGAGGTVAAGATRGAVAAVRSGR